MHTRSRATQKKWKRENQNDEKLSREESSLSDMRIRAPTHPWLGPACVCLITCREQKPIPLFCTIRSYLIIQQISKVLFFFQQTTAIQNIRVETLRCVMVCHPLVGNQSYFNIPGVAKILLREPVFVARGRFPECKGKECNRFSCSVHRHGFFTSSFVQYE